MAVGIQKGFTLVELMIVVAIVGILSSVAVPAYRDYALKAKVTEALNLSGTAKAAATEVCMKGEIGGIPPGIDRNDAFGLPDDASINGTYTESVRVDRTAGGATVWVALRVSAGFEAMAREFNLIGTCTDGAMAWQLGTTGSIAPLPSKYLPRG